MAETEERREERRERVQRISVAAAIVSQLIQYRLSGGAPRRRGRKKQYF